MQISGSVSHSACQPPSPRSCSCTIAASIVDTRPARASPRRARPPQPTGLRLCGIVDEPPRPGRRGLERFADLGLRQQRDIARDLAERADEQPERRRDLGDAVAVRVPGQVGQREARAPRPARRRRRAPCSPSAASVPAAPPNCSTATRGAQRVDARAMPLDGARARPAAFRPERDRRRLLQPGPAGAAACARAPAPARPAPSTSRREIGVDQVERRRAAAARGRCRSRPGWSRPSARSARRRHRRLRDRARQRLDQRDRGIAGVRARARQRSRSNSSARHCAAIAGAAAAGITPAAPRRARAPPRSRACPAARPRSEKSARIASVVNSGRSDRVRRQGSRQAAKAASARWRTARSAVEEHGLARRPAGPRSTRARRACRATGFAISVVAPLRGHALAAPASSALAGSPGK